MLQVRRNLSFGTGDELVEPRGEHRGLVPAISLLIAFLASVTAIIPTKASAACGSFGYPRYPAPVCNTWKCTPDGWIAWPVAAGARCNNGVGYCDGGIIVPGQLEPDAFGKCITPIVYRPKFHLQSVIYMPPGRLSSVSYGYGSSEGSRVSVQTSTSNTTTVQAGIFGLGGSTSYTEGIVNGTAFSMTKTDSFSRSESANTTVDAPLRGTDVFDIWFNATISYYYSTSNGWRKIDWGTVNGASPVVYSFTADELLGSQQVSQSNPDRYNAFGTLTAEDKSAILWMDAPLSGTTLDPRRYQLVEQQSGSHEVYGPDYAGAPIFGYTYSVAYNSQYDIINGSFTNDTSTVLGTLNVGVARVGGSETWTENYSETRTSSTGAQKLASITLKTSTVGCYMDTVIYIDAVFGTYLVLPTQMVGCNL